MNQFKPNYPQSLADWLHFLLHGWVTQNWGHLGHSTTMWTRCYLILTIYTPRTNNFGHFTYWLLFVCVGKPGLFTDHLPMNLSFLCNPRELTRKKLMLMAQTWRGTHWREWWWICWKKYFLTWKKRYQSIRSTYLLSWQNDSLQLLKFS